MGKTTKKQNSKQNKSKTDPKRMFTEQLEDQIQKANNTEAPTPQQAAYFVGFGAGGTGQKRISKQEDKKTKSVQSLLPVQRAKPLTKPSSVNSGQKQSDQQIEDLSMMPAIKEKRKNPTPATPNKLSQFGLPKLASLSTPENMETFLLKDQTGPEPLVNLARFGHQAQSLEYKRPVAITTPPVISVLFNNSRSADCKKEKFTEQLVAYQVSIDAGFSTTCVRPDGTVFQIPFSPPLFVDLCVCHKPAFRFCIEQAAKKLDEKAQELDLNNDQRSEITKTLVSTQIAQSAPCQTCHGAYKVNHMLENQDVPMLSCREGMMLVDSAGDRNLQVIKMEIVPRRSELITQTGYNLRCASLAETSTSPHNWLTIVLNLYLFPEEREFLVRGHKYASFIHQRLMSHIFSLWECGQTDRAYKMLSFWAQELEGQTNPMGSEQWATIKHCLSCIVGPVALVDEGDFTGRVLGVLLLRCLWSDQVAAASATPYGACKHALKEFFKKTSSVRDGRYILQLHYKKQQMSKQLLVPLVALVKRDNTKTENFCLKLSHPQNIASYFNSLPENKSALYRDDAAVGGNLTTGTDEFVKTIPRPSKHQAFFTDHERAISHTSLVGQAQKSYQLTCVDVFGAGLDQKKAGIRVANVVLTAAANGTFNHASHVQMLATLEESTSFLRRMRDANSIQSNPTFNDFLYIQSIPFALENRMMQTDMSFGIIATRFQQGLSKLLQYCETPRVEAANPGQQSKRAQCMDLLVQKLLSLQNEVTTTIAQFAAVSSEPNYGQRREAILSPLPEMSDLSSDSDSDIKQEGNSDKQQFIRLKELLNEWKLNEKTLLQTQSQTQTQSDNIGNDSEEEYVNQEYEDYGSEAEIETNESKTPSEPLTFSTTSMGTSSFDITMNSGSTRNNHKGSEWLPLTSTVESVYSARRKSKKQPMSSSDSITPAKEETPGQWPLPPAYQPKQDQDTH